MNLNNDLNKDLKLCTSQYWGEYDTNIRFCERNYYQSQYISEYYNTYSNILFILLPIHLIRLKCDINLIYTMVGIGIGSALFHATTRYYSEFIYEFFMFIILMMYNWKLYNILGFIWCPNILSLVYILYFLYIKSNYYTFFHLVVFISAIFIYLQLAQYYKYSKNIIAKKLIKRSLYCLIIGIIFWIIDQYYVVHNSCYKISWIEICHPLWHVCTALCVYYLIIVHKLIVSYPNCPSIIF